MSKTQQSHVAQEKKSKSSHEWGKICWNCEEFVDPDTHRYYMKPIVNQEEDSSETLEAQSKSKKKKKTKEKEGGFLRR